MMTDLIADLLTRIRNALAMKHAQVAVPHSRIKEAVVKILQREGYLAGYEVIGKEPKASLVVQLKYLPDGTAAIANLERISKPGRRVFCGYEELKPVRAGMGTKILTTPKGILSDAEARNQKVGGEILLEVW